MRTVLRVSPGEMLEEAFLTTLDLSKYRLPKDIGVPWAGKNSNNAHHQQQSAADSPHALVVQSAKGLADSGAWQC
jgi:plasmid maintenance system antidote protein VapI